MKKTAVLFAAAWLTLALIVDVIFAWRGGEQATISWQIQAVLHDFPVIAFALGFLAGHLFWQIKEP